MQGLLYLTTGAHLLQQEYTAQAILDGLVRSARAAGHAHDYLLVLVFDILDELFRYDFTGHGTVRDGIIGPDAIRLVDVEGTHVLLLGDFE
jgi:hypothetical protein